MNSSEYNKYKRRPTVLIFVISFIVLLVSASSESIFNLVGQSECYKKNIAHNINLVSLLVSIISFGVEFPIFLNKRFKAGVDKVIEKYSQKYFNVDAYLKGGFENVLAKNFHKELLENETFKTDDETSFFVLLNEILSNAIKSDENNKIEGIYSIFSISRTWQMQYFQENIQKKQHELRKKNPKIEIKKTYRVLNKTEYDQSNFREKKLPAESLLLLLNQMHYSKLFFDEGLKKDDILVFPKIGSEEERFPITIQSNNQQYNKLSYFLNTYKDNDFILIKKTDSLLKIKINRKDAFEFREAEFSIIPSEEIEKENMLANFLKLYTIYVRAQWKPTDREYALISADKIKNDSVEGGVVYAIDLYADDTWLDPTEPRWVVWRACKDAIEKVNMDRTGGNQLNNSLKIKRLFIIGDDILADKEKRKNFLLVIAFQYYLDIDVTFVTVEKYKEWAASIDETLIKEIGIDLKNVLPDFSLITGEKQQTISGVNMMDTNNNSHHGRIYEKDENWKKFVDLLFPNSKQETNALKTEIPTDNKQLILSFKDNFDKDMKDILKETSLDVNSEDILKEFNKKFEVSYDKIKAAQKNFWDMYWNMDSFLNISQTENIFDKIHLTLFKSDEDKKIKILDVGCGDGRLFSYLNDKGYNIEYYALDQSQVAIDKIKEIASDSLTIKQTIISDLSEMSNRDYNNFFDVVIAIDFMNHQFNWEETLKIINRLLKQNGYFIGNALSEKDGSIAYYKDKKCTEPEAITEYGDSKFLYELDNDRILIMNFSTKDNVQGKLQDSGFTEINIEEYSRTDNGHKHPFIETDHKHSFYWFTCQKK